MIIGHEKELKRHVFESPEVKDAAMKVLISPENGWQDHVMRIVELEEAGYTPRHIHDWPHINYVVEGRGVLHLDGRDTVVEAGSFAYLPAGSLHQFKNDGQGPFRFICIVPKEGHSV
jgi:quercetin dioxygenase-like cupin family protein